MELGFARFLEMFEERFGRVVTTLLLAMLALAVAAWAIQTTIEAAIYVYGLVKSAHFIAALNEESAASHLITFAIQIAITYAALWAIWRWFFRRKLGAAVAKIEGLMLQVREAEKKFDEAMAKRNAAKTLIE